MSGDDRTMTHVEGGQAERRLVAYWQGGTVSSRLPDQGLLTLGRSSECDVVVDASSVSRTHAILRVTSAGVLLEDLGSSNGTFVNDQRLAPNQPRRLTPADAVRIGSVTVVIGGLAGPAPAPIAGASPAGSSQRSQPIARDPKTLEVFQLARAAAAGRISVLIIGETGVGKESIAETVHHASSRASGPFTRINCAAIPETLFESTLFGTERGAFTGASAAKAGALEATDGGTLFLDEVSEIPVACQAKLLRALESGEVLRVGSFTPRQVDVRFVAATNRDPNELVQSGAFREDLLYRLNGLTIQIPPLRDRPLDLEPLAQHFLHALSGGAQTTLSPEVMDHLRSFSWPGNIRQLRNVLERALLLAQGRPVSVDHLPAELIQARPTEPPGASLKHDLESLERDRILEALERCGGNQTQAAKLLGIARRTLVSRIEAYGLPRPRKGR